MNSELYDAKRVFRMAAWMWLVYLALQFFVDLVIYFGRLGGSVLSYYLVNFIPALVFLGISYLGVLNRRNGFMTTLMILLISLIPILMNPLFDLKLPQAPLSNIEGTVLRQLPVLIIGLILVAWNYNIWILVGYTLLLSLLELGIVLPGYATDRARSLAFLFTVIIRTVCFLVVGVFTNQLIQTLRSQRESLKNANQQLTHFASTLENLTISRERNRISRELHDTVVHTLSGLSVQLETAKAYLEIDPNTTGDLLTKSLDATRTGLTETRRALRSMRASPLEDLGLIQALHGLLNTAAERANLKLVTDIPEQVGFLPPDIEQCIYRIAQEAVENVVHHANAKSLTVKFHVLPGKLMLILQDDGIGFDPKSPSPCGHFGLIGMVERAKVVGGDLELFSKPNGGTSIQLVIKDSTS